MAISITARGVNQSGSTDDNITVSVTAVAGSSLLIGVLSDGGEPTSVKWGTGDAEHEAEKIASVINSTSGLTNSVWLIKYVRIDQTADAVATWAATNSERLIAAQELEEATVEDIAEITATQDASTAPNTGTAGTSLTADTIQVAFFGNDGRAADTLGTVGDGHTSLQSGGSVAAGSLMHITYEILAVTGSVRGSKTGATSRDWCNIVVCLKKRQTYTISICEQRHRHMNQKPNYVWVVVADESGDKFEEPIDPYFFDQMTDNEFKDWLRYICTFWTANNLDDDYEVIVDTTRKTRMDNLVNDTVTI